MITLDLDANAAPAESSFFQVRRSSRLLSRYVNKHLRKEGEVRSTQFDVLAVLAAQKNARNSIAELAVVLGVAACTLSRSLKRLAGSGYVEILERDGRTKFPRLTNLGRAALEGAREVVSDFIQPRITSMALRKKLPVPIKEFCKSLNGMLEAQVTEEIRVKYHPEEFFYSLARWLGIPVSEARARWTARRARTRAPPRAA